MVCDNEFCRIAWENKNEVHFRPESGQLFYSSVTDSENKSRQSVKEQAVKIARSISIFGICPALFMLLNINLDSINNLKPLGPTSAFLIANGVVAPLVVILNTPKMKTFAKDLLRKYSLKLNCI